MKLGKLDSDDNSLAVKSRNFYVGSGCVHYLELVQQ